MVVKSTLFERLGGIKGLLSLVGVVCIVASGWAVNDYRISRVEIDLAELESDCKDFTKEVLNSLQSIEVQNAQILTRLNYQAEDIKSLKYRSE